MVTAANTRPTSRPADMQAEPARLDGRTLGGLASPQKRLWSQPVAADLERTEVLVPIAFRHFRIRVNPDAKLIEVGDTDGPVAHPVDQVLADSLRQITPRLDLWHQPPNTIRPI